MIVCYLEKKPGARPLIEKAHNKNIRLAGSLWKVMGKLAMEASMAGLA